MLLSSTLHLGTQKNVKLTATLHDNDNDFFKECT